METAGLSPSRSSLESDLTCDVLKSIVVIGEGLEASGLPFCSFEQLSRVQVVHLWKGTNRACPASLQREAMQQKHRDRDVEEGSVMPRIALTVPACWLSTYLHELSSPRSCFMGWYHGLVRDRDLERQSHLPTRSKGWSSDADPG